MSDQGSGQWLLVSTFRADIGLVVAKGSALGDVITEGGGQQLHRALGKPRTELLNNVRRTLRRALREGRPAIGPALSIRGSTYRTVADPVRSGGDHPFAVWVWVGLESEMGQSPPLAGAWMWNLEQRPFVATYGPRIGALYGRPDLIAGRPYDINELTPRMTIDVAAVGEHLVANMSTDGAQMGLSLTVERDGPEGENLGSLRAMTEIVIDPSRNEWEWRGVTWDVTDVDPPLESTVRAAAHLMAGDGVWTATAYWWPIQLLDMSRTRPADIYVDPDTRKAVTHSRSRGVAARMIAELLHAPSASAELWLRTVDGDFVPYEIVVSRLRGATLPAATVSVRRPRRG